MINDTPEQNPDQSPEQNSDTPATDAATDAASENGDQHEDQVEQTAEQTIDLNIEDILDPVSTLQAERDELKDQMLRAVAEADNTRRRAERDVAQARKYGHTGFARDLISVVENLSRAVEALPEQRDDLDETMKNLVIGVEMISREMASILERHGITRILPMGEKFDHNKHQAMFEVPTNDAEPGVVVQVAQSGWMLHDRLLSPAMVGVAKAADPASGDNNAADKTNESSE
ncbi:nucleotide exchange factor GrpE [Alphaproteobacteria bacterium]|nr:nucleotide exchange factor GrpE [Alphaproteobacteria bacterium]